MCVHWVCVSLYSVCVCVCVGVGVCVCAWVYLYMHYTILYIFHFRTSRQLQISARQNSTSRKETTSLCWLSTMPGGTTSLPTPGATRTLSRPGASEGTYKQACPLTGNCMENLVSGTELSASDAPIWNLADIPITDYGSEISADTDSRSDIQLRSNFLPFST